MFILANCSGDEDNPIDKDFNIASISPETGSEGDFIGITGVGFSEIPEENLVKFNGIQAEVESATESTLLVKVPTGATTGKVTVTRGDKTAEGPVFTVTVPTVTKAYFVKFKANGVVKVFETSDPGYQSCGQCACSYVPVLSETRYANVEVCNNKPNWITAADIQGWNGDKITINAETFPTGALQFKENDVSYSSNSVADQTGSELNITSVVADGTFFTKKAFKVTGNFKCKVASSDESSVITITEGTFVLRYSED